MSSPSEPEYEVVYGHIRQCDAPTGCDRTVTHWSQKKGYTGPVYCRYHAHLAFTPKEENKK